MTSRRRSGTGRLSGRGGRALVGDIFGYAGKGYSEWHEVDAGRLRIAWAFHTTNDWARHSWGTLWRFLSGLEWSFRVGDMARKPTPDWDRLWRQEYVGRFMRDAAQSILVTGVVPVTLRRLYSGSDSVLVPCVPPPGTYYLEVRYNTARDSAEFRAIRENTDRDEQILSVLSGFGYDPNIDGTLASPVSAILDDWLRLEVLKSWRVEAEAGRTHPVPIREAVPGADAGSAIHRDRLARHAAIDAGAEYAVSQEEGRDVNREARQRAEQSRAARASRTRVEHPSLQNALGVGVDVAMLSTSNEVELEPGMRIAGAMPTPLTPENMVEEQRRLEEMVGLLYGVPRSLTTNERSIQGNTSGIKEFINLTLDGWLPVLERLANGAYTAVYAEGNERHVQIQHAYRSWMGGGAAGDRLEGTGGVSAPVVVISVARRSATTTEELLELYRLNVISENGLRAQLQLQSDLPPASHSKEPQRALHSEKERRELARAVLGGPEALADGNKPADNKKANTNQSQGVEQEQKRRRVDSAAAAAGDANRRR